MTNGQLKRSLNLPLLTLYGLGTILGAGVYVLVGKVAGVAGIYAPIAFLVSAIIAGFTGYSYAALSARYPRSAGEVVYVSNAFRWKPLATTVGWFVIATGTVSSATLVNGFVGYLSAFIDTPNVLTVTLVVIAITLIACWGITESVTIAAVITAIELIGLLLVLNALSPVFLTLPEIWPTLLPPTNTDIWLGILLGAFLAFYAFIGFEDIVNVAEEVIDPQRTLPLAIMIALGIASLLYVLVALAAILSLPSEDLAMSDYPMISLLENKNDSLVKVIGIISLVAIINGALVQIIMGARMLYGMSVQNCAPTILSKVSLRTQTPIRASCVIGATIWLLAIGFPLVTLAKMTSFIIILVFALVNFSLLTIRFRELRTTRTTLLDILLPFIGGLLCLALLAFQLIAVVGYI